MKKRLLAMLLGLILIFSSTLPASAASRFPDVKAGTWFYEAIETAASRGWIEGLPSGEFAPDQDITYAELLALLTRVFCPSAVVTPSSPWYAVYCNAARERGMLKGTNLERSYSQTGDWSQEEVDTPSTRYELALILSQGAGLTSDGSGSAKVPDWTEIPSQYRTAVSACYEAGLFEGTLFGFQGSTNVTRAQAATLLCRLYAQQGPSAEDERTAQVLNLINAERIRAGAGPLALDSRVMDAAKIRAEELTVSFNQNRPDGSSPTSVYADVGITPEHAGEVTAANFSSPQDVIASMMDDENFRSNILYSDYTLLGVGYAEYGDQNYWVLTFVTSYTDGISSDNPAFMTLDSVRNRILELVNEQRTQNGLSPVTLDNTVCQAAQIRVNEILSVFDHKRPDGTSCFTVYEDVQVEPESAGENIASGYDSPDAVVNAWMNSEGHRENILTPGFTKLGIGYMQVNGRNYWTQLFTSSYGPLSTAPGLSPEEKLAVYREEVLRLVNQERAAAGLSALTLDTELYEPAMIRAEESAVDFGHTRPDGRSCFSVFQDYGISYRFAGENLAYGFATPESVVKAWMNSPGHRANILSGNYGRMGVGYEVIDGTSYWSQLFRE